MLGMLKDKSKNLKKNKSIFSDYIKLHESISSQIEQLQSEPNYFKKLKQMVVNYIRLRNLEKVDDIDKKITMRLDHSQHLTKKIVNGRSKEHYRERISSFKTQICSFPIDLRNISPFLDYIDLKDENIFLKIWNSLNVYLDCQNKGIELKKIINSENTRLYHSERERYNFLVQSKIDALNFSNIEKTQSFFVDIWKDLQNSIEKAEKVIQFSREKINHLMKQVENLNDYNEIFNSDYRDKVDNIHHRLLELLSNGLELDHVLDELIIIENKVNRIESDFETFIFNKKIYAINEQSTIKLIEAAEKYYENKKELESLKSALKKNPQTITSDRPDSLNMSLLNIKLNLLDMLRKHKSINI